MEDGEEEEEDSVPSFAPNTQVETKGSDLTCRVSTHHVTNHQIVVVFIELYSYLLFYCCTRLLKRKKRQRKKRQRRKRQLTIRLLY